MTSLQALLNPETPSQPLNCAPHTSPFATIPLPYASRSSTPDSQSIDPTHSRTEDMSHAHHENCPDSLDCLPDTDGRPQHTLPIILRCAILGSAKRRLTIRDIYAAMEKKYPYYKTAGPAWKQSVRHHLSLNRLFERQAKPVTEPGFGSYWTVNLDAPPGTKRPRKRGRQSKNAAAAACEYQPTRRGRPKRGEVEGFECDLGLAIPPIATLPTPTSGYSHRQYRLHSVQAVQALPLVQNHGDDDEMFDTLDSHEAYVDGRSLVTSDDADESEDDLPDVWPSTFGQRTFFPSPPRSFVEQNLTPGASKPANDVERLQEEIRELRRHVVQCSAVTARMASELSDAHAEIARLRIKSELLGRGM